MILLYLVEFVPGSVYSGPWYCLWTGGYKVCVCTSLYPPGYLHEHTPETLMISHQYYAHSDKYTCNAKCSMICKLFVTPSTHKYVSVPE